MQYLVYMLVIQYYVRVPVGRPKLYKDLDRSEVTNI